MPLPAEGLTPDSSQDEIRAAVSASIAQCMQEGGREQEECTAMAMEIARRATGNGAGGGGQSKIRAGLETQ